MDRRKFLSLGTVSGLAAASLPAMAASGANMQKEDVIKEQRFQNGESPWPICLDTATIRPASLREKVQIAAKAGYDAIEPWDRELEEFQNEGGNLKDLGKEIKDLGMFVPSIIGLWNSMPPTQKAWEESLADTRRRMQMAADIGSEHVQTIPNTVGENYNQQYVAGRYREIIEIGLNEFNLSPALVFVKYFPMKTMGQAMGIAMDANHPQAKIIPDTYHMHISEGGFEGLKLIKGESIAIFQFADAPATPAVAELKDEHRVYPGDGILPLPSILQDLKATGFKGCVSLELYNPNYWEQDLQEVAQTGLRKTMEVIRKAKV